MPRPSRPALRLAATTLALAMALVTAAGAATAGPSERASLCHHDATRGSWALLSVPTAAAAAHRAHGDGVPGGAVPGAEGYSFDEECGLDPDTLARAGCFDATRVAVYLSVLTDGSNRSPAASPSTTWTQRASARTPV